MANIVKKNEKMEFPLQIKRQFIGPIDTTAIWYSLEEAKTYAKSGSTSYVGQTIAVVNEEEGKVKLYIIDINGDLSGVGTIEDLPLATAEANGILSKEDFIKLRDLQTNLNAKLDKTANAVSASKLETPRNINGIAFDGTEDIIINSDDVPQGETNLFVTNSEKSNWNDKYTKTEIDNLKIEINQNITSKAEEIEENVNNVKTDLEEIITQNKNELNNTINSSKNELKGLIENKANSVHTHNASDITEDDSHKFVTLQEKEKINTLMTSIEETSIFKTLYEINEPTTNLIFPEEMRSKLVEEQIFVNGIKLIKNIDYTISENLENIIFNKEYNDVNIELIIYNKVKVSEIEFATVEEIRALFQD